jgi:DNA-binding Lrp family transcriptional regulator
VIYAPNSDIFKEIAGELEDGIQLAERPFGELASRMGISEESVLDTAREMLRRGFMRRFGAFFDHRKLGYAGYLFGVSAPVGTEPEMMKRICGASYVTHVYEREHALNIWFTVLSKENGNVGGICDRLRSSGREYVALRASKVIKLRPSFVGVPRGEYCSGGGGEPENLDSRALRMVRAAALVSGISERPFEDVARLSGMPATELLDGLRGLSSRGIVRRIGASFDHYRAGWKSNSLCAFDLSAADENETAGIALAAVSGLPWASHCYIRWLYDYELSSKWPYNLYVMVHAVSDGELGARERHLREVFGGASFVSLRTRREIKHTHFDIFSEERG